MSTLPLSSLPLTRRRLLGLAAALVGSGVVSGCAAEVLRDPQHRPVDSDADFLADLGQRTFRFFWDTTDARTGLAPDRWPTPSFASIAAVGFALSAYPVGVARGWVSRAQARERTLTTLAFLHGLPQGPQARGVAGHHGFFYHFLDMADGLRFAQCELSTIDTALLMAGVLHAQVFFDADQADEARIRALAQALYDRVDWTWAQARGAAISHGWLPESGFLAYDWKGYNEALLLYVLALGSSTHAVGADAWQAWTSPYSSQSWGGAPGHEHLQFAPLFGHQFSHCWIDFRGLQDSYLSPRGLDYFENSRRATLAQQAYAVANPQGWRDYGPLVWGISASDGPADVVREVAGRTRQFHSYAGRGMGAAHYDDGTIAPYAAGASIAFAPEIVIPTLRHLRERYGAHLWNQYGFLDAFNPSFEFADVPLQHGRLTQIGWVDGDQLGIDQGPLLAMLANHHDEAIWQLMRRQPVLRRGLQRAGFHGGWLAQAGA
jgi:hypothetical protein